MATTPAWPSTSWEWPTPACLWFVSNELTSLANKPFFFLLSGSHSAQSCLFVLPKMVCVHFHIHHRLRVLCMMLVVYQVRTCVGVWVWTGRGYFDVGFFFPIRRFLGLKVKARWLRRWTQPAMRSCLQAGRWKEALESRSFKWSTSKGTSETEKAFPSYWSCRGCDAGEKKKNLKRKKGQKASSSPPSLSPSSFSRLISSSLPSPPPLLLLVSELLCYSLSWALMKRKAIALSS